MIREQRFRFVGIIFYIVLVVNLLVSEEGISLFNRIAYQNKKPDTIELLGGLVSLGLLLFTSEAVGFFFSTIFRFFWNLRGWPKNGGYSTEWANRLYDIRNLQAELLGNLRGKHKHTDQMKEADTPSRKTSRYCLDVFLSYFWQQGPSSLLTWVARRYTAFFANWTSFVAILLALVSSAVVMWLFPLHPTIGNLVVLVIALLLSAALIFNGEFARREGWQMIDLWLCKAFNPEWDEAIAEIERHLSIGADKSERPESDT